MAPAIEQLYTIAPEAAHADISSAAGSSVALCY